jgi:uncharacterized membrane protein YoaK (UPF0700 family)
LTTARSLPFVLSVIAGGTDIIGVLALNGLFTAHITGNLVMLAARIVVGLPVPISYILSVPVFMLVLLIAGVIARAIERDGGSSLQPLLLWQLLALVAFLLLGIASGPWKNSDTLPAVVAGMCGVIAMAVQNTLVQVSLKDAPSTAVMTTNVTRLILDLTEVLVGRDAADVAKAKSRAMNTWPVVIGFGIGCALGAAGEVVVGLWSLMFPTAVALFAFVIATWHGLTIRQVRR